VNWIEQIDAELEKLEEGFYWPVSDDSPEYLKNAERQIAKAAIPTAKLKPGAELTARLMGTFVGHKLAYVKPFAEGLTLAKRLPEKTPERLREVLAEAERSVNEYYPRVLRTVERCIALACSQPLREAAQFFSGMARALEKGSLDARGGLAGATTATDFYWILICIGPRLTNEVRSLAHMHQLCVRWFGQRAGDLKTTEKRCERIGLSFSKKKAARMTPKSPT
jgi:hypothetical protein